MRTSALTCHQRIDPLGAGRFHADGVVHGERPVDDAALDLAALGHLAQRRRVQGGGDLKVHRLDRREDADLRRAHPQRQRQVDGVLHDVDLRLQGREDVDRGVGHEQGPLEARDVHHEDVADAAAGPQPSGRLDHLA